MNRAHHGASITPWNVFFYDINLALFGFSPRGHYVHMLSLIALASLLLFCVLRQGLEWHASLAGASALLLAGPTVHIAQFLMVGHYATGLVFSLAALYGWLRFAKGGGGAWIAMGAASYLLACLCKEVCVPLVLVLPFLGGGPLRLRLRAWVPFVGVAVGYAAWRRIVLGVFLGGSSPTVEGLDPLSGLRQIAGIPYLLLGRGPAGVAGVLLLATALLLAWRAGRVRWLAWTAVAAAVSLPLVPLTIMPGIRSADRYVYFPAVALAAGIAVVWPRSGDPAWRLVPAIGVLAALGVGHVREWSSIRDEVRREDALYRFAERADRRTQGLFVEGDHGYLLGVLDAIGVARGLFEGRPPSGRLAVLTDTSAVLPVLACGEWQGRTYFRYAEGEMRPMTASEVSAAVAVPRKALERGRSQVIRVEFRHEAGMLRWEFGPWDGDYQIGWNGGGMLLTRRGVFPWSLDRKVDLNVCYEGAEGWVACTPRLIFDPRERSLLWSGAGVAPGPEPAPPAR